MKVRCGAFLLIMILPAPALADSLQPGSNDPGVITHLGKGLKELGLDSMLVVGYDKTGEASSLKATLLTGPTFRYFIRDNLNLAVNASFLFKKASAGDLGGQTDIGGLGTIAAGYHASPGRGMFLEPLIGVGGFFGTRTIGKDPGRSVPASSAAPVARGSGWSSTRARASICTPDRKRWCRSARAAPASAKDS
jgi:hypothetical protein